MRPASTTPLYQIATDPSLEAFAQATAKGLMVLLTHLGVSEAKSFVVGKEFGFDPPSPETLQAIQSDLERHGKLVLTVHWGMGKDDWETLCVVAGLNSTLEPAIIVLWMGQDAHQAIIQQAAKPAGPVLH